MLFSSAEATVVATASPRAGNRASLTATFRSGIHRNHVGDYYSRAGARTFC